MTAANGGYFIDASKFRGSGLPAGSLVDVTATMTGYRVVKQSGTFDRSQLVCDFQAFNSLVGSSYEDRRLPAGSGATLSFTKLLPDYVGAMPTITGLSSSTSASGGGATVVIDAVVQTGYSPSMTAGLNAAGGVSAPGFAGLVGSGCNSGNCPDWFGGAGRAD